MTPGKREAADIDTRRAITMFGVVACAGAAALVAGAANRDDGPGLPLLEGRVDLSAGLIGADDLPGEWSRFTPGEPSGTDLCGEPRGEEPLPVETASVAWAVDPDDGPIVGERIDRYESAEQARSVLGGDLTLPCEFTSADGAQWRTERLDPPSGEAEGRVFLVTSRDGPGSFNFEAAVVIDDVAILVVLNTREDDRALLDEVLDTALATARSAGVVS